MFHYRPDPPHIGGKIILVKIDLMNFIIAAMTTSFDLKCCSLFLSATNYSGGRGHIKLVGRALIKKGLNEK